MTVLDLFLALAQSAHQRPLITFVDDAGRDRGQLSFAEMERYGSAIAAHLLDERGLRPGDRVLLVYAPSLDFVKALVGCLMAGVIAVPVCPPSPNALAHDLVRFSAMAENAEAAAVISHREYMRFKQLARVQDALRGLFGREQARWPELPWYPTDTVRPGPRPSRDVPPARPDDIAVLQYTSGSTSAPKGVMITHANLRHQLELNRRELEGGPNSRIVMWVPHYHDFGLISGILTAVSGNGHLYMLSPLSFIQRPAVWFDVISRVAGTHTAAPNFAYELMLRKTTVAQRAAWDLRSLRVAMSAAEPVRAATVRAFIDAFAPCGFHPDAFCPAYGLAEHTVGVSVNGRGMLKLDRTALEGEGRAQLAGQASGAAVELVGCGRASEGVRVRIVDPDTNLVLGDGHVGEIWVDSPSKAAGYYRLPEETERTFRARIADDDSRITYLRTGDLGFLHEGQLYITGRRKDLIIVRGRNLYPQDIEESVRDSHRLVRPGGVAAFPVDVDVDGVVTEQVALVIELRDEKPSTAMIDEVIAAAQRRVLDDHQVACHAIWIGRAGAIPKTTSGKLQRRACRRAFEEGSLDASKQLRIVRFAVQQPPKPALVDGATSSLVGSDPRLVGLDPAFEQLIAELGRRFSLYGKARGGRAFHLQGTTLAGELEVAADRRLPANTFFAAGRRYPVLVRHANGAQDDDAACDNRGATLRVLDPATPDALDAAKLDLLLTTGRCFLQGTASGFVRWMAASEPERVRWANETPHIGLAAWEMFRQAKSFATLHYHSKVANRYLAADGREYFARFRLVPESRADDYGFLDPAGRPLPPELMPRDLDDLRSRAFLHEELHERISAGGIGYLLQVQLRGATFGAEDEEALDCTKPWPEQTFPFLDLAVLRMSRVLDDESTRDLSFNPGNAPPDVGLVLATSPDAAASLNHVRSIVYSIASAARTGSPLSPELARLVARATPPSASRSTSTPSIPRRVCVVGAGVSGLTAARALEKQGHRVTVLERAAEVGGKCGSVAVGDHWFDLGGHFCSDNYKQLGRLVAELAIPIEPTMVGKPYDMAENRCWMPSDPASLGAHWHKYVTARDRDFPALKKPGYAEVPRTLATPAKTWLAQHGLETFAEALAITFTSSGYGYLSDPELPALYFLKAVDTTIGAAPGGPLPPAWTIRGGFLRLWRRVAAELRDVRCGVDVRAVERGPSGVRVRTDKGTLEFDDLVVATPLHETPPYLDVTDEERAVFGKVRHLDYYTTIVTATGLPERGFYLPTPHCTDASMIGKTVAFHHRYAGDSTYLFYANGTGVMDGDAIVRKLREDVTRIGGRVEATHGQWKWAYFPHFRAVDVAEGIHERLESLQGQRHTYFVGSLFNFELVECNVAYATDLVSRHFAAAAGIQATSQIQLVKVATMGDAPDALYPRIAALVQAELELPELPSAEASFGELGLDSMRAMTLLQRLSAETGVALTPTAFFEHPTVGQLCAHVLARRGLGTGTASTVPTQPTASVDAPRAVVARAPSAASVISSSTWFEGLRAAPRVRLFCFHHAGSSAEDFAGWPELLPAEIEVQAVTLPGRGPRTDEDSLTHLPDLLAVLEAEIAPLLDRPFAFFGHSLGAMIAFELTRRLRNSGRPLPFQLFLSGFASPGADALRDLQDRHLALAPSWLSPLTQSDLRLFTSWRFVPEEPLDIPITALGGEDDPVATPHDLEGWRRHTHARFERHLFPGGHFYLQAEEASLLACLAQRIRPATPVPHEVSDDRGSDASWPGAMERFVARWKRRPAAYEGSLALYDLAWIARAAGKDDRPLFPDALAKLREARRPDGGFGPDSPLPACELLVGLAVANTFLRWHEGDELVRGALDRAFQALDRMGSPPELDASLGGPHERYFHFSGLFSIWIPALAEIERLLDHEGRHLDDGRRETLAALIEPHRCRPENLGLTQLDHARCFAEGAFILNFGEVFPESAFHSPEARAHARVASGLPGFVAPVAARYAEATGDPATITRLTGLLTRPHDGLWPAGRQLELAWSIFYLLRGGVDVRRYCADPVARLSGYVQGEGLRMFEGAPAVDCDPTAVALCSAFTLGLPTRLSAEWLDRFWSPEHTSYIAYDGRPTPNVSTEIHILDAFMAAPDVPLARKAQIWRRTIDLLSSRPWFEKFHVSPFYVWEGVTGLFRYAHQFPEHPTTVHEEALDCVLAQQDASGGFKSAYVDRPNVEETGLALLSLRAALTGLPAGERRARVERAATAARAFLFAPLFAPGGAGSPPHPELWVGKLLTSMPNLIEAISLAALADVQACAALPEARYVCM